MKIKFTNRKKAVAISTCAVSALAIGFIALYPSLAFFKSSDEKTIQTTNGTVTINQTSLKIADATDSALNDSSFSKNIQWEPGDIKALKMDVENNGNKSIATRHTLYIYWDGEMSDLSNYKNLLYLFPYNVSNDQIKQQMLAKNVTSNINIGDYSDSFVLDGITHKGYKYTFYGDLLDGVGSHAETGDADEVNYANPKSIYDDSSKTKDTVNYKLALSNYANALTSNKKVKIVIVTEAMQARNTNTDTWKVVSTTELN